MATLNIRNIDEGAAERIKRAAAARDMTIGQYLAALSALHHVAIRDSFAGLGEVGLEGVLT